MKTPFEKELKNKLLIKTIGNQSEEMILLRAFKYFDLSNTNLCDKQNFIKTVMKIGITGFTENNLSSIFDLYDIEKAGKINYKDFIGNLYNNPSIMDNPSKLNPIIHMPPPNLLIKKLSLLKITKKKRSKKNQQLLMKS